VTISTPGEYTYSYYSVDAAGNEETAKSVSIAVDLAAPHTTASISGSSTGGSNYNGPVAVTLSAADDLSGVGTVEYRLDDGTLTSYAPPACTGRFCIHKLGGGGPLSASVPPITISAPGAHTLTFYSTDVAGNVESQQSVQLTIAADTVP
jgi:hypothetical protein